MGIVSWLFGRSEQKVAPAPEPEQDEVLPPENDEPSDSEVKVHHVAFPEPASFQGLSVKRVRAVGQGFYLTWQERESLALDEVVAVRDPENPVDPNAVAIVRWDDGRKLGYISRAQAAGYAPLIEQVGALRLDCRVDGSRLWLHLPRLPELRAAVQ